MRALPFFSVVIKLRGVYTLIGAIPYVQTLATTFFPAWRYGIGAAAYRLLCGKQAGVITLSGAGLGLGIGSG